jgi:putative flippase GtrA
VPMRKAKTIKITANSISYLIKYFFNNFWSFDYKARINLN